MSEAQPGSEMGVPPDGRAVLLLAHGTPDSLDEIPEYLRNVTSGRPLPPEVVEEIRHRYSLIGKSPLTEWTFAQARQLQAALGLPVFVGMRNWKPYVADTVREMREANVTEAVAICLAPHNSRTSVGLYRRAALAEAGSAMRVEFVEAWADHPLLIEAFAEKLRPVWGEAQRESPGKTAVLFTAHSVPCRTVQGAGAVSGSGQQGSGAPSGSARGGAGASAGPDPYPVETKRTAALVAAALREDGLGEQDWYFAFQSQGMSGGPWIGPTVEDTLAGLKQEGYERVVLQAVGFLCDHVEILYDVDIAFQRTAADLGLRLTRPESLNGSEMLTAALAQMARERMAQVSAVGTVETQLASANQ